MRSKFDGGKVINRSQSGSWEHRCLGAGLRHNLGSEWGPIVYKRLTMKDNEVYQAKSQVYAKKLIKDKKRKGTDKAKESRRRNKYLKIDNSTSARKAYSSVDTVGLSQMKSLKTSVQITYKN